MDKAEQILEKHINENDLNFIFHEKKNLWQELLNVTNEALGLAHVGNSLPERNSGEMWSFLLVNALRCLTEEQRAGLCFDLYSRSKLTESIDKRIVDLKKERQ